MNIKKDGDRVVILPPPPGMSSDIGNYVDQSFAKFVTGADSVETGWDTYKKQLDQIGLPRYLELQ